MAILHGRQEKRDQRYVSLCGVSHTDEDCRTAIRQLEAQRQHIMRMPNCKHKSAALQALNSAIELKRRELSRLCPRR